MGHISLKSAAKLVADRSFFQGLKNNGFIFLATALCFFSLTLSAQKIELQQKWATNQKAFIESAATVADIDNNGLDEAVNASKSAGLRNKTSAEKLGFPSGKKVLLLHIDDAGMCPEANTATQNYIGKGYLHSAAVMMPCPNAAAMIAWARNHPDEDIGLHLTLTSEWSKYRWGPLSNPAKVPGLIDPEGKLWAEVPDVISHASASEVETEIRAQLDKSIAMGYRPGHIDSHMGTLFESVDYIKVFMKVAEEYHIPANIIDFSNPETAENFAKASGYPLPVEVISQAGEYKLPKLDNFTSVPEGKTYAEKRDNFFKMVESLREGLTEIIFHPSVPTENMKSITATWQQRAWEAELFADPLVIQFFKDKGVIFTNWKEIMKRFDKQN